MEETEKSCLDELDFIWDKYKVHAGKLSVAVACLGGVGSVLAGLNLLGVTIILGVTNCAVFVSGIAYEKLIKEASLLEKDNSSLKEEKDEIKRRLNLYEHPNKDETLKQRLDQAQRINKLSDIKEYLEGFLPATEQIDSQTVTTATQTP